VPEHPASLSAHARGHGAAVEKFADLEKAAQAVKEQMDKKFGAPWNVVVGEDFTFEITYEVKNLLYVFLGGVKGVLLWK